MKSFTLKNKEWEQQALEIAAEFTIKPFKIHNSRWQAVMTNADGVPFDIFYGGFVESGVYGGSFKTKTAAAAYVLTEAEMRRFIRACFDVAEAINPFDPFAEVTE